MKRVCVLSFVLLFLLASSAMAADKKIQSGNVVVGGAGNFGFGMGNHTESPEEGDDLTSSTIDIGLETYIGYFVINGLELGPLLGVNYDKMTQNDMPIRDDAGNIAREDDITTTATTYDLGAQIGYFLEVGSVAVPFFRVGAAYVGGSRSVDDGENDASTKLQGFMVGPRLGVDIFFTRAIALELGAFLDYQSVKATYDSGVDGAEEFETDLTDTDYGLAVGFNIFF